MPTQLPAPSGVRATARPNPLHLALCAVLLITAAACGGDGAGTTEPPPPPPPPPSAPTVARVSVDRTSATLANGGRLQLTASALDANNQPVAGAQVAWAVHGTAVTVSAQGLVTAVAEGAASVSASSSGHSANVGFLVVSGTAGTTVVTPANPQLLPDDTVALTVRSFDANGVLATGAPTWTSSDTTVARVLPNGRVVALQAGTVTVRATTTAGSGDISVRVFPDIPLVMMAASRADVCALATSGALYCAGRAHGAAATRVGATTSFAFVDGFGDHFQDVSGFCAIDNVGAAWCWGSNGFGQLGVGDLADRAAPTRVAGDLRFMHISAGDFHTCGITTERQLWCWGNGARGALGTGNEDNSSVPVRVPFTDPVMHVSAGNNFTCAIVRTAIDSTLCWGRNLTGQLGDDNVPHDSFVPRLASTAFVSLPQRNNVFTCALTAAGYAWCWGNPSPMGIAVLQCPYLPSGTHNCIPVPGPLDTPHRFKQLGGNVFGGMCGLTHDGAVHCWGLNVRDRHGITGCAGAIGCLPQPGPPGTFTSIGGSVYTNCGIRTTGRGYCWGDNQHGQLTLPGGTLPTTTVPQRFRIFADT
jgi:hypothetical protein